MLFRSCTMRLEPVPVEFIKLRLIIELRTRWLSGPVAMYSNVSIRYFGSTLLANFLKLTNAGTAASGLTTLNVYPFSADPPGSIWNDDDGLTPSNSRLYAAFAYWMAHNSISIADAADFTFNNMLCSDLVITGLK